MSAEARGPAVLPLEIRPAAQLGELVTARELWFWPELANQYRPEGRARLVLAGARVELAGPWFEGRRGPLVLVTTADRLALARTEISPGPSSEPPLWRWCRPEELDSRGVR